MKRSKSRSSSQNSAKRQRILKTSVDIQQDQKEKLPALFAHWKGFLDKESFTDLKILCKDDILCATGGVSLHKAILASISPFLATILADGRDETVLILPDVERNDLLKLVKIMYGSKNVTEEAPGGDLLKLLGIKELPELTPKLHGKTATTCKYR